MKSIESVLLEVLQIVNAQKYPATLFSDSVQEAEMGKKLNLWVKKCMDYDMNITIDFFPNISKAVV